MAKEPDSLVLRLLRDIRATQDGQGKKLDDHGHKLDDHGRKLDRLEKRIEDRYKISTHTLGVAANAHVRYEALEEKVEKLTKRISRLEAR